MNQPGDNQGPFAPMPPVMSRPNAGFSSAPLTGENSMAPPFIGGPVIRGQMEQPMTAEMPWESTDEGSVEPAFEGVVDATTEALGGIAVKAEEFPMDAFIIPEDAQRVPTGMDSKASAVPEHTPATELADRIEKLSHRLRVEDSKSVIEKLAAGDRLDSMLAGLLAGFLSRK
jgi:hypothetical protein